MLGEHMPFGALTSIQKNQFHEAKIVGNVRLLRKDQNVQSRKTQERTKTRETDRKSKMRNRGERRKEKERRGPLTNSSFFLLSLTFQKSNEGEITNPWNVQLKFGTSSQVEENIRTQLHLRPRTETIERILHPSPLCRLPEKRSPVFNKTCTKEIVSIIFKIGSHRRYFSKPSCISNVHELVCLRVLIYLCNEFNSFL